MTMTRAQARQILGLPQKATWDEIKKAYSGLRLEYHPDKLKVTADSTSDEKNAVFALINKVRLILGKPKVKEEQFLAELEVLVCEPFIGVREAHELLSKAKTDKLEEVKQRSIPVPTEQRRREGDGKTAKPASKDDFIRWLQEDGAAYPDNASIQFALSHCSLHENCWRLIQADALSYEDFENEALNPETPGGELLWKVVVENKGVVRYVCEQLSKGKRKLTAIYEAYDHVRKEYLRGAVTKQGFNFYCLLEEMQLASLDCASLEARPSSSSASSDSALKGSDEDILFLDTQRFLFYLVSTGVQDFNFPRQCVIPSIRTAPEEGDLKYQLKAWDVEKWVWSWMVALLRAYSSTPDERKKCEIHEMSALPEASDRAGFRKQYIFLRASGALFYIQNDDTVEAVPLTDRDRFIKELSQLQEFSQKDAEIPETLFLTVERTKTLITDNGGHTPWDFERMLQQLCYLGTTVFADSTAVFSAMNTNIIRPIKDKIEALRREGNGYVFAPLQGNEQVPKEGEILIEWVCEPVDFHIMEELPERASMEAYEKSYIFTANELVYIDSDGWYETVRHSLTHEMVVFLEEQRAANGGLPAAGAPLRLSSEQVACLIGSNGASHVPSPGSVRYKVINPSGVLVSGVIDKEALDSALGLDFSSFQNDLRASNFKCLQRYINPILKLTEKKEETTDRNPEKAIKIEQLNALLKGIGETVVAEIKMWKEDNARQPQPMLSSDLQGSQNFDRMITGMSESLYKKVTDKVSEFANKAEIAKHRNRIRHILKGLGLALWTVSMLAGVGFLPIIASKRARDVWWNGVRGGDLRGNSDTQALLKRCGKSSMPVAPSA